MKEIIKDLNKRDLSVVAFIVKDEDENIKVISYDEKGNVDFISENAQEVTVYETFGFQGSRIIQPLAKIG